MDDDTADADGFTESKFLKSLNKDDHCHSRKSPSDSDPYVIETIFTDSRPEVLDELLALAKPGSIKEKHIKEYLPGGRHHLSPCQVRVVHYKPTGELILVEGAAHLEAIRRTKQRASLTITIYESSSMERIEMLAASISETGFFGRTTARMRGRTFIG